MDEKLKVLFLCTGNSARSQIAEAFLRKYGSDKFEAYSAGLEPKGMNPYTVQVMTELGFDLSGQRSKNVREFVGRMFINYVVTVCDHAEKNCPTAWPGVVRRIHWCFEDPAAVEGTSEQKLAKFREIRDLIHDQVRSWLAEQGVPVEA